MALTEDGLYEYLHIVIQNNLSQNRKSSEDIQKTLDSIGFKVGYQLIERMVPDTYRLVDEISVMKYVCKEFWTTLFSKQIDNLKTNNSGIFVLQDNNFKILSQSSSAIDPSDEICRNYLAFICGLLRGALTNLGYSNTITADSKSFPCCKFQINLNQIQIKNSKAI